MRKIKLIILSILFISLGNVYATNNYETQCVTIKNDGYITIKIWNAKQGKSYKYISAKRDAIHAILFSGIAEGNGCQTQYPILNAIEEIENFNKIETDFFSKKGDWNRFIRSSTISNSELKTTNINKMKIYEVCISINELRKYLENQKIINSLKNGF